MVMWFLVYLTVNASPLFSALHLVQMAPLRKHRTIITSLFLPATVVQGVLCETTPITDCRNIAISINRSKSHVRLTDSAHKKAIGERKYKAG